METQPSMPPAVAPPAAAAVPAAKRVHHGGACCCKWGKECHSLQKSFEEANDPHGRGVRALAVGWNASGFSPACKAAFAGCLGLSVAACEELAKSNKQGILYVNRLHYDPRQLALFASNRHARLKPRPWSELKAFTDVLDKRGSVSKKSKATAGSSEQPEVPHFFHYPNYPFASAKRDAQGLASPRAVSARNRRMDREQRIEQEERDRVLRQKRRRLDLIANMSPEQVDARFQSTDQQLQQQSGTIQEMQTQLEKQKQEIKTLKRLLRNKTETLRRRREASSSSTPPRPRATAAPQPPSLASLYPLSFARYGAIFLPPSFQNSTNHPVTSDFPKEKVIALVEGLFRAYNLKYATRNFHLFEDDFHERNNMAAPHFFWVSILEGDQECGPCTLS